MRTYAELVKEAIRAAYEKSENEYKKFEVGRTYATRSVCNSECIFKITIIKRTEKTVTIDEGNKGLARGGRKPKQFLPPAPKCFYYHSRKIEEFQEVKNDGSGKFTVGN